MLKPLMGGLNIDYLVILGYFKVGPWKKKSLRIWATLTSDVGSPKPGPSKDYWWTWKGYWTSKTHWCTCGVKARTSVWFLRGATGAQPAEKLHAGCETHRASQLGQRVHDDQCPPLKAPTMGHTSNRTRTMDQRKKEVWRRDGTRMHYEKKTSETVLEVDLKKEFEGSEWLLHYVGGSSYNTF